jgi:hypothetical protein
MSWGGVGALIHIKNISGGEMSCKADVSSHLHMFAGLGSVNKVLIRSKISDALDA